MSDEWNLFKGDGTVERRAFPPAPPWRKLDTAARHRAETYTPTADEIRVVNVALHLRRPLLVEGPPGSGKSSLGHAVARELDLGSVLVWPINSRTTLRDGLYRYDAIGRMHALAPRTGTDSAAADDRVEDFLTLGPLGTALVPAERPRVLIIDEIDKSDIDLPNDLLHALEDGAFTIPELERIAKSKPVVEVLSDPGKGDGPPAAVKITNGRVQATTFPFVVITSNGERELPPAFLRRCVRYTMAELDDERLRNIVEAHLKSATADEKVTKAIGDFVGRVKGGELLAIDQLLNAVFLLTGEPRPPDGEWTRIAEAVLRDLQAP